MSKNILLSVCASLFLIYNLSGCTYSNNKNIVYDETPKSPEEEKRDSRGSLFGENAFKFSTKKERDSSDANGVNVNAFLWRASLDTVSFMPLASADPFGGVIITEWYSLAEAPHERTKITIKIMGRELRASGIKVDFFRQVKDENGEWISQAISEENIQQLEDAILTRARELRIAYKRG